MVKLALRPYACKQRSLSFGMTVIWLVMYKRPTMSSSWRHGDDFFQKNLFFQIFKFTFPLFGVKVWHKWVWGLWRIIRGYPHLAWQSFCILHKNVVRCRLHDVTTTSFFSNQIFSPLCDLTPHKEDGETGYEVLKESLDVHYPKELISGHSNDN